MILALVFGCFAETYYFQSVAKSHFTHMYVPVWRQLRMCDCMGVATSLRIEIEKWVGFGLWGLEICLRGEGRGS